jgi:hypothetical protein
MEHQRLWVSIFTAVIGLAVVSVLLSKNSATGSVIQAVTRGLGGLIAVAVSPISGSNAANQAAAAVTGGQAAAPGGSNITGFTQTIAPVLPSIIQNFAGAAPV